MSNSLYQLVRKHVGMEKLLQHLSLFPNKDGFLLCPFHDEKTPSLKVYGDSKGYYCFGCQSGGGSVEFFAKFKKIRRRKAVDDLAKIFKIKGKRLTFEKKRVEHTEAVLRSWERETSYKSLRRIFMTTGDLRAALYTAWWGHCCGLLDQAKLFIDSGDGYGVLVKLGNEITEFLDWTEGVYRDEYGDSKDDHAASGMEQEETGVLS